MEAEIIGSWVIDSAVHGHILWMKVHNKLCTTLLGSTHETIHLVNSTNSVAHVSPIDLECLNNVTVCNRNK